jgi:hypothetical protein
MAAYISKRECDTVTAPFWKHWYTLIKISINEMLMIFGCVRKVIENWFSCCFAEPTYWQVLWAKEDTMWLLPRSDSFVTPLWKQALMEHQQCLGVYGNWKLIGLLLCRTNRLVAFTGQSGCNTVTVPFWKLLYPLMKMSVNRVSTIFGVVYWRIKASRGYSSV